MDSRKTQDGAQEGPKKRPTVPRLKVIGLLDIRWDLVRSLSGACRSQFGGLLGAVLGPFGASFGPLGGLLGPLGGLSGACWALLGAS